MSGVPRAARTGRLKSFGAARVGSEILSLVERKAGITPSGVLLLACAAVGWFLARAIGSPAMLLVVYAFVAVLVISWVMGRRRLAVVSRRSDLPARVREGQIVDVELTLVAGRRLSTIVLEETLHHHLGTDVHVAIPFLPAGEEVTHVYSFTPRLRGVYEVGPLVAAWSDPFGLTRQTMRLLDPTEIVVHPTTEPVADRVLSREWEDPPIRPPVSKPWPTGFEFYGTRDYVSGDDPRRIIWRASARMVDPSDPTRDRLVVREAEQGITDRVGLVLDTDGAHHSPGDPSETFELAVKVVASLGAKHIKDGFAVSVQTNGGRIADQLRGLRNRIRLFDQMARVQRERIPLRDVMSRLLTDPRRDTHLVLVTPHLDQEAATRLRLLLDRGVSVLIVLVMWNDTDPLTVHRAGSLGTNVVEVAAGMPLEAVFRKVAAGAIRRF